MQIDPTLAHYPYAAAVADTVPGPPHLSVRTLVGAGGTDLLEATLVHRPTRTALVWQPDLGWRRAATNEQFSTPENAPRLTTAVAPNPADVARALAESGEEPFACAETAPAEGPLPGRLAIAVADGDLDQVLAARLATYVTGLYPYEDLWEQSVVMHMDTGAVVPGQMLPSTGEDRFNLRTHAGDVWFAPGQVLGIEAR